MNLLIFLDLSYNPCKNFKFYSLQEQNVQIFLIFTYNQGKILLILPITRGHMYTWSPLGVAPLDQNPCTPTYVYVRMWRRDSVVHCKTFAKIADADSEKRARRKSLNK